MPVSVPRNAVIDARISERFPGAIVAQGKAKVVFEGQMAQTCDWLGIGRPVPTSGCGHFNVTRIEAFEWEEATQLGSPR